LAKKGVLGLLDENLRNAATVLSVEEKRPQILHQLRCMNNISSIVITTQELFICY